MSGNKLVSAERGEWLTAAVKRSHAVEDLPDAIIETVRAAKMDKRYNQLNKLMKWPEARLPTLGAIPPEQFGHSA